MSWNCGVEGDAGAPDAVLALRRQQVRNFCALLMLANGIPMIVAGDEFLNTQRGNNNPYNQDNEITWLDWARLDANRDIFRFFKLMIAFRKAHARRPVRPSGVKTSHGTAPMDRWISPPIHGASPTRCAAPRSGDGDLFVMINGHWEDHAFTLPDGNGRAWRRVVDTARPTPDDIVEPGHEAALDSGHYMVRARSVVVCLGEHRTDDAA